MNGEDLLPRRNIMLLAVCVKQGADDLTVKPVREPANKGDPRQDGGDQFSRFVSSSSRPEPENTPGVNLNRPRMHIASDPPGHVSLMDPAVRNTGRGAPRLP
jgi:hypothetical protein